MASLKEPTAATTAATKPAESIVARFIMTPILFVSFLVSLFLIDRRTYAKVLSGHTSHDSYYHSHQRKMAKQEMEDAFHMRNRVLGVMFVLSGIGFAFVGWTGSKAYHALFPSKTSV